MKAKFLFILMIAGTMCQAQTKVIAHKSHSGSRHSFAQAYNANLFDMSRSNFGLPGNAEVSILDTIIAINDSLTVIKWRKSNVCHPVYIDYKALKASDFSHHRDTLIHDPVLNRKRLAAYIQAPGSMHFLDRFRNPLEEVVVIGFEQ